MALSCSASRRSSLKTRSRPVSPATAARRPTIVFSRDIVFDDPASAESFAALFEQEIARLQAYFDDRGQ